MPVSLRHSLACCLALGTGTLAWVAHSQDSPPPVAGGTEVPSSASAPRKPGTSTSTTRQFVVHGGDLNARSAFCLQSEDTSAALGRLLKDGGKYTIPVVVVLKTPPDVSQSEPAVNTTISQLTHGGFHLQMTVQMRPDFRAEDYARELVRVLLAERILRDHKELSTSRQRVLPDWLLTGVKQAMDFRSRSKPSVLFAAVFRSGQVYSIDNILAADPTKLDALSRGIYEVSSCALLLALLDQPDAPLRFSKFLNALASSNTPDRELLQQHFPTLGISKNSLEKWWTLQMAALSTPTAMEAMSVADTEKELDKALQLRFETTGEAPEAGTRSSSPRRAPAPTPKSDPVATVTPAPEEKKSGGFFGFGKNKAEKKEESKDEEVAAADEKPMTEARGKTAPPVAEAPEPVEEGKKSGGFFSFGRGKTEAKDGAPAVEAAATKPKVEAEKPAAPAPEKTAPVPEKKPAKEEPAADKPKDDGKSLFRSLNPFGGGRKVIFPFDRKKKEDDTTADAPPATAPAKAEKAKPTAPAEPEKPKREAAASKEAPSPAPAPEIKSLPRKPRSMRGVSRQPETVQKAAETAASAPAQAPASAPAQTVKPAPDPIPEIPSLSRKPSSMRSVGSHPDDLPAVLPPLSAAANTPAPDAQDAAASGEDSKGSLLNPLNWFRKEGEPAATPGAPEAAASPTPASRSRESASSAGPEKHIVSLPLEEYAKIARRDDREKILRRTVDQLSSLRLRAHPLYKPVISGYIDAAQKLVQGKEKTVAAEISAMNAERAKVRDKAVAVESYLDWYEASEIHTYSGTFDDYLNLREKLDSEIRTRDDAISKYLDTLEKEYE